MAKMKVPGGHMVGVIPEAPKGKTPEAGKKSEVDKKPAQSK
jgi:hypothetical protein